MPAGRVLIVILVMLLSWTLLYAPRMKRAAEASPLGIRRTVSLAVLTPFAAASEVIGLDALAETIERAVGREPGEPGGPFVPPPEDIPKASNEPNTGDKGEGNGENGKNGGNDPSEETEPIRTPTPTRRLRVVVVGDSLAAGLGYFAERVFRPMLVRVFRQGRISTGLTRPDYFDWPIAMRRIVNAFDPDLVIVMLGENDHQPIHTVRGEREATIGTSAWPAAYRQRVLMLMRIATSRGAKVVWAGMPLSSAPTLREHTRRQNDIFQFAAEITPNVAYFDSWGRFSDGGKYTAYFREGGRVILIREGDGLHFNAIGYTIVAREIAELAAEEFGLSPRTYETAI
jgi:hypothetical protein